MEALMENLYVAAVPRARAGQLAFDLGTVPGRSEPVVARELAPGYATWSTEEIVGLHFVLLDDLRRLADAATPLEERFELLEWVFTDRAREDEPFSFGMCVRLYGRTCDPDGMREALRPLSVAWLREAVARLPVWLSEQILRAPQAAAELHRNPQAEQALCTRASRTSSAVCWSASSAEASVTRPSGRARWVRLEVARLPGRDVHGRGSDGRRLCARDSREARRRPPSLAKPLRGVHPARDTDAPYCLKENRMTATVAIRLNKRRLIENFRFAFPNRCGVVAELMQNARRAGASSVAVSYARKAQRLVVQDDGCGIADFQKLFTLGESGWCEAVQRTEQPFGLGFLQSLYAAGRCTVESNGQRVQFETRAALAGATVGVERCSTARGTTVTLEAIELAHLDREIVRMTRGFPIPVEYNGVKLRRPHAPDALPYARTAVGLMHLAGIEGGVPTRESAVYLQGLLVEGPMLLGSPCNVVHLDPVRFQARLPDRDRLIEHEAALEHVDAALAALWRDRLLAASGWQHRGVCRAVLHALGSSGTRLFNDVPVLPEGLLQRIVGYPRFEANDDAGTLAPFRRALTRAEVESGRLRIACLGAFGEDTVSRWLYARERAYLIVAPSALDAEHWLHGVRSSKSPPRSRR
jgi:hypothetical protein